MKRSPSADTERRETVGCWLNYTQDDVENGITDVETAIKYSAPGLTRERLLMARSALLEAQSWLLAARGAERGRW